MTELEQIRADLQTLEAAASIANKMACFNIAKGIDSACIEPVEKEIAALEAEQADPSDPWKDAKEVVSWYEKTSPGWNDNSVAKYVRHLEAELAKLDEELRCERIDGGKVLDQSKEIIAELKARLEGERIAFNTMADHAAELLKERDEARAENADLKATIERDMSAYGKLAEQAADLLAERNKARAELAKRSVLESATTLAREVENVQIAEDDGTGMDFWYESLAELITIKNSIPPACHLAHELMKKRIDVTKQAIRDMK